MRTPVDVQVMLQLHQLGWGVKRIALELGVSKNTVKRYVRAGGWVAYGCQGRRKTLDDHQQWIEQQYRQHRGNAEVVRQELVREHSVQVSVRTVERAVAGYRRQLRAEAEATVRFETAPGKQLQCDFGEMRLNIGGEPTKVHFFVGTLGYSRRPYVEPFEHERVGNWLTGIESSFRHFAGVPEELLVDNARALVRLHNTATGEIIFSDTFHAFAHYWDVRPYACAPFRARTKGKDESGVGYVKGNAIAGRQFESWEALRAHLAWWMREIADERTHGTTGEKPIERFRREEAAALKPLLGRSPFIQARELPRMVSTDLCVELDTNHYSVPWRLIGEEVTVLAADGLVRVLHAGAEVARHVQTSGRREWVIDKRHFQGLAGLRGWRTAAAETYDVDKSPGELQRPLSEYEAVTGGRW
jgi:transposase